MARMLTAVGMIIVAALTRFLPHPPNVAPITAIALFGAMMLDRRWAIVVPLAAMLISDAVLGFHNTMIWVYASFAGIVGIGFLLKKHPGVLTTVAASLAGSVLFFVVTNFGVWLSSWNMYPHTTAGLVECYVAALPFFRNSLVGDLAYVAVLFGLFEVFERLWPAIRTSESISR
jgi:hypothetical protein